MNLFKKMKRSILSLHRVRAFKPALVMAFLFAAASSFAEGTTAVVDLTTLGTTATTQLGSVGTIIVGIGGTIVAVVAVIAGIKFVKRILA